MIPLKLIGENKKVIDEKVHQITKELDIESLLNK
jgi:putative ABC transport system ATP-binding protein